MIRNHRRFALVDVTFDGQPVGGATIDAWQNGTGHHHWSARVLMAIRELSPTGELTGRLRDGRLLRGRVALVGPGQALHPRGAALVEWCGVSAYMLEATTPES